MSDQHNHKVVVVGAGLTGVMTALALSYCGYGSPDAPAITLIDRANRPKSQLKTSITDYRTTTINAAGMAMLEVLGVWPLIATAATPITCIKVAHGHPHRGGVNRQQKSEFRLDWHDDDTPMAYVVGNQELLNALYKRLATRPVIQINGHEVTGFDQGSDCAYLQFDKRPDLMCQLVVACDGVNSKIREFAAIRGLAEPHKQTAIVANLILEHDHENIAFQRFLPTGPIALMPYGVQRASLVWSLPKDEADRILALDKNRFESLILASFGKTLGCLTLDGPRLSWPLKPTLAQKMTSSHLVLAGDASHAIHPLAGQGYNLALSDAAVLADTLMRANLRGLTPSHPSIQNDYLLSRALEVTAMTAITSGLNQLMSFHPAIGKIAGAGMSLVNISPLKPLFHKCAVGGYLAQANLLEGRLPK